MSESKFRVTELNELEEKYLEGYPNLFNDIGFIEEPEFVLYLKEYPESRFAVLDINKVGLNEGIEEILIRIGAADHYNVIQVAEFCKPTLVVEDLITARSKEIPYYRFN